MSCNNDGYSATQNTGESTGYSSIRYPNIGESGEDESGEVESGDTDNNNNQQTYQIEIFEGQRSSDGYWDNINYSEQNSWISAGNLSISGLFSSMLANQLQENLSNLNKHINLIGYNNIKPTFYLSVNQQNYNPVPQEYKKTLPGFPGSERLKSRKGARPSWNLGKGWHGEWDFENGEIEVYDKNNKHQGAYDPKTGIKLKDPKPGRIPSYKSVALDNLKANDIAKNGGYSPTSPVTIPQSIILKQPDSKPTLDNYPAYPTTIPVILLPTGVTPITIPSVILPPIIEPILVEPVIVEPIFIIP